MRVRSTTSHLFADALKGRGGKELVFAFVSLGRFRDVVWVGCLGSGEPLEISSDSSSMMINFGEADALLFELEGVGVRFVMKGNVVC